MSEWSITISGLPWWLVLPLGLLALFALWRLQGRGLLADADRRVVNGLRSLLLLLLLLMLCEPSLVWQQRRSSPPRLLAVVDASASMATRGERIAAGQLLDLVALETRAGIEGRDLQARRGADRLRALLAAAVAPGYDRQAMPATVAAIRDELAELPDVAGMLDAAGQALAQAPGRDDEAWAGQLELAIDRLLTVQEDRDAAWFNSRGDDDELRAACEAMRQRSRLERARLIISANLQPALAGHVSLRLASADEDGLHTMSIDEELALHGETDLARLFETVHGEERAQSWDAVVLFSDGRNTGSEAPDPFLRALQARGTDCHLVQVGDERAPLDAVVAALEVPEDVYRQELVPVQVRYRVPPARGGHFDLCITADDQELYRRQVAASEDWSYASAVLPMPDVGTLRVSASLEPVDDLPRPVPTRGVLEELWLGEAADGAVRVPTRGPDARRWLDEPGPMDAPGLRRLRGRLVPGEDGIYRFAIAAQGSASVSMRYRGRWIDLAQVDAGASAAAFDGQVQQRSALLRLQAGRSYPIELLHSGTQGAALGLALRQADDRPWQPLADGWLLPPAPEPPPDLRRDNNSAVRTMVVHDEPLRVLMLDRLPRWDLRLLQSMASQEGQLELETRVQVVQEMRGEGGVLPTSIDDLLGFDAVIIGDLLPQHLQPAQQDILSHYVAAGGSLMVLAGRRAMPGAYHLGRMADLLPVIAEGPVSNDTPVRCRLPEGADHPAMRLLPDERRNRRLWNSLPPLRWAATGVAGKVGSRVLLESDDGAPLIASQRYGAGRVVYIGSDETWRWRAGIGDRLQHHLWLRLLRWGTGVPLRGHDPRLQVALERSLVHPGERGVLRLRSDRSLGRQQPQLTLYRDDEPSDLPLHVEREGLGSWRVSVQLPEEGRYRFTAHVPTPEGSVLVEERSLLVRQAAGRELIDLSADRGGLQRLAGQVDGGLFRLGECDRLAARLLADLRPSEEVVTTTWSLWDGMLMPLLIILLLSTEWCWRRWRGLP